MKKVNKLGAEELRSEYKRPVSAMTSCKNLRPQACLQVRDIALDVFERFVFTDAMGLKEAVHLDTRQADHAAEFRLGDMPGLELFEGEGFKRPT